MISVLKGMFCDKKLSFNYSDIPIQLSSDWLDKILPIFQAVMIKYDRESGVREIITKISNDDKFIADYIMDSFQAQIQVDYKTREVYVAYRKAGYSKKFREEHEEEILLHQAAKNAFDEMGVKKLSKVKELQTEYAKLLEEKKKTYAEYRHSREEMRELLTAKANVDRVLKMEVEQDVEKEKDHGQR